MDDAKLIETCNSILEKIKNIDEDDKIPFLEIDNLPFLLFNDEGKPVTADYLRGYIACMAATIENKDTYELFFQKMKEYRAIEKKNKELWAQMKREESPCYNCKEECFDPCWRAMDYINKDY